MFTLKLSSTLNQMANKAINCPLPHQNQVQDIGIHFICVKKSCCSLKLALQKQNLKEKYYPLIFPQAHTSA